MTGTLILFGAIMAGYLLAVLVPFGFGTVARAWLVARRQDLKLLSVLATVALDRLTDGFVFIALVPIAVFGVAFVDPGSLQEGLFWSGLASAALFVLLLLGLELYRRQARRPGPFVQRLGNILPVRFADKIRDVVASFAEGIHWPDQAWRGIAIMLASVVIKVCAASQFWAAGLAFGVRLHPAEYLFVMIFLGFLVIIGHFLRLAGGFLIGAVFALGLFGVPKEEALTMAIVVQAMNLMSVGIIGAVTLWTQGIALSDLKAAQQAQS